MKHLLILVALISAFVLAGSLNAKAPLAPEWFRNLSKQPNVLIGYASDKDLVTARAMARSEIAGQIEISVSAENEFSTTEQNGVVEEKVQILIREKVDVSLEAVYTLREVSVKGVWYVALGYDNLPLVQKIAHRFESYNGIKETQNAYLSQTSLIRHLNNLQDSRLNYQLLRSGGRWWLYYAAVTHPLSNLDIGQLLTTIESETLSLESSNPNPLLEGTVFSLRLEANRPGYYSLVNVYENGEVFVMESNRQVNTGESWSFPDPQATFELMAGLLVPGKGTHDMYMLVYSPDKLPLTSYPQMGLSVYNEEYYYKFAELIELLNRPGLEFASIVVHTLPTK